MNRFDIKDFSYERTLNEDPNTRSITLLGSFSSSLIENERDPAIIRIEKTALPAFSDGLISSVSCIDNTDIYTWLFGWLNQSEDRPDVKINIVCPATEVHVRKYSKQQLCIFRETPLIYERIVKPYIDAFPASRTQWVRDIISGRSEAEKILFRSTSDIDGFLILPDMKWDLTTISSLYLVAITLSSDIKSLRDLQKQHIPLLKAIQRESSTVVKKRWGLDANQLRLFVHYQPSYYHFHVHIVNVNHTGFVGMVVGQAHLLDDIISLLELDLPDELSIFQRMTLTYGLGEQHGLFKPMLAARADRLVPGEDTE
ncbi:scavenger mRNA decapping enzyme [Artomyces pyxidatus]|uniref:Scavenger mRNA decapping enzyme n=1 Tax=Artomyces pyxidatus TaxID=48021 RepID=A0ACB8SQ56_9AGAM|nr:scavenger mRNA decapping enzyme [Artomyces pyxidatus]